MKLPALSDQTFSGNIGFKPNGHTIVPADDVTLANGEHVTSRLRRTLWDLIDLDLPLIWNNTLHRFSGTPFEKELLLFRLDQTCSTLGPQIAEVNLGASASSIAKSISAATLMDALGADSKGLLAGITGPAATLLNEALASLASNSSNILSIAQSIAQNTGSGAGDVPPIGNVAETLADLRSTLANLRARLIEIRDAFNPGATYTNLLAASLGTNASVQAWPSPALGPLKSDWVAKLDDSTGTGFFAQPARRATFVAQFKQRVRSGFLGSVTEQNIRQVITEVTGDPLARLRNSFDGIVATANTAAQSASRRQNRNHRRCRHSALVPRPGRLRLGRTPRRHRPVRPRRCRRITRHHRPDRLRVDQVQSPPPRRRHRCQRLLHRRKGRRRTRYRSLRHRRRGRRFPR